MKKETLLMIFLGALMIVFGFAGAFYIAPTVSSQGGVIALAVLCSIAFFAVLALALVVLFRVLGLKIQKTETEEKPAAAEKQDAKKEKK